MSDDAQLAKLAARGKADALERLVRGLAPRVFAFLYAILGDAADAADAMEESFVRMARGIQRLKDEPDVDGWAFGTAARVALDHAAETPATGPMQPDPLMRALSTIPADGRVLVACRERLGWGAARIAAVLDRQPGEVEDGLRRARESLARALAAAEVS